MRSAPPRYRTRLLTASWAIPGYPAFIGVVLLIGPWLAGAVAVGLASVLALLRSTSRVSVTDGLLRSRFFGIAEELRLDHLTEIRTDMSKMSLGYAPALRMADSDGNRLSLRLGWWRSEPELLGIIAEAVVRSGAHVDIDAAQILRTRPSGEQWDVVYVGELPQSMRRGGR